MITALWGCAQGKRPFEIVQICLNDEQGISVLKQELRLIANSEKMEFIDNSAETEKDLKAVSSPNNDKVMEGPIINVGVLREDGVGLIAGNVGLPGYQAAIGFSEGENPVYARAFARKVVKQLAQHWQIIFVSPEKGAQPLKNCR